MLFFRFCVYINIEPNSETLDGSFSLIILYDFDDKKCRLVIEVNEKNQKIEFKKDELNLEVFEQLKTEIEFLEKMLKKPKNKNPH